MARPPRVPGTPLLSGRIFRFAIALSVLITAATLVAYLAGTRGWASGDVLVPADATARGRTYAFMTLAFAQLWLVGVARWPGEVDTVPDVAPGDAPLGSGGRSRWRRWTRNPWAWAAVILTSVLQVAIDYVPPLASVLQVVPLDVRDWVLIATLAVAPALVATIVLHLHRALGRRAGRRRASAA